MSIRHIFLSADVVWTVQCSSIIPKVHDGDILWFDWEHHGSLYGWFLLRQDIWGLLSKPRQSATEVPRGWSCPKLGEGLLHGQISEKGIEVDKAKIEVIEQLPPPTNVKGVHSFWDMQGSTEDLFRTSLRFLGLSLIFWPKMPHSSSMKSVFKHSTHWRRHSSLHLLYSLQTGIYHRDHV